MINQVYCSLWENSKITTKNIFLQRTITDLSLIKEGPVLMNYGHAVSSEKLKGSYLLHHDQSHYQSVPKKVCTKASH